MRTTWPLPLLLLALAACGAQPPPVAGWKPVEPGTLSAAQKAQQERGLAAKDAVLGRLQRRLKEAFATDRNTVIDVCRVSAPGITADVAKVEGVRIGRTSFKLRNPANAPPDWARDLVVGRAERPVWLAHGDGGLAGLLPIRTKPLCLQCHGAPEAIPAEFARPIARLYPEDRAVGFGDDELRGWFWVEIPAP